MKTMVSTMSTCEKAAERRNGSGGRTRRKAMMENMKLIFDILENKFYIFSDSKHSVP